MQRKAVLYDKGGDQHYDYISAWIKATRGSDPDASLYYLAAMLEGGEDPRFIARRMVILASEDVGNADPQALLIAIAAAARRRARRPARGARTRSRSARDLPVAGAEVERRQARASAAPARHIADHGAATAAGRRCATAAYPGERASIGPRGRLRVPARRRPATSTTRSTCPTGLEDLRFYAPDDAEAAMRRAARRDPARARPASRERAATTRSAARTTRRAREDPRIAARSGPRSATRARCSTSARAPGTTSRATAPSPRSSRRR